MTATTPVLDPLPALRLAWMAGDWHRITPPLEKAARMAVLRYRLAPDDVDDVVANALVRAWTFPSVPDDPFRWISTVARHLALDFLKSKKWSGLDHVAYDDTIDGHADTPESEYVARETHLLALGRLRQALRRLPDPMRRCLVLRDLHGRSHEEIAEALTINVGAVKMRVHRARKLLAKIYEVTPAPGLTAQGHPRIPCGRPPAPLRWRDVSKPKRTRRNAA